MMSTDQLVEFERVMSYAAVDFSIAYRAADYAAQKHTPMERPQAGPCLSVAVFAFERLSEGFRPCLAQPYYWQTKKDVRSTYPWLQ